MTSRQSKFSKSLLGAIALVGIGIPFGLLTSGLPATAHEHHRSLIRFDFGGGHRHFNDYFAEHKYHNRHHYVVYFRRDDDDTWQFRGNYRDRDDAEREVYRLEREHYFARYERE
jgi:hypothetical protein